jgi:hypothetical protein
VYKWVQSYFLIGGIPVKHGLADLYHWTRLHIPQTASDLSIQESGYYCQQGTLTLGEIYNQYRTPAEVGKLFVDLVI